MAKGFGKKQQEFQKELETTSVRATECMSKGGSALGLVWDKEGTKAVYMTQTDSKGNLTEKV